MFILNEWHICQGAKIHILQRLELFYNSTRDMLIYMKNTLIIYHDYYRKMYKWCKLLIWQNYEWISENDNNKYCINLTDTWHANNCYQWVEYP